MKLNTLICYLILFSINIHAQNIDELGKLYSDKDYENTIKLGKQILQDDPDNPLVNSVIGRALTDAQKHKEAIPFLIKGTVDNNNPAWNKAWSFGYLGMCYFVTDNFEESKKCFKNCINLNATKNSTHYATKYLKNLQMNEVFDSWKTIEGENIRFHFQNNSNPYHMNFFMKKREEAYLKINEFFGASPSKKIDYFVWDKPEDAKSFFGRELGFANSKLCIINSRNNQTKGHEITHILSDHGIRPVKTTILINEGVAVYFDQRNRDRMEYARNVLQNKEIDIIDLWNNPNNYPNSYNYIVGGALIDFLMKKGSESQLKALLKNQTTESAIKIYADFNALMNEFEQKLN